MSRGVGEEPYIEQTEAKNAAQTDLALLGETDVDDNWDR